MPKLRSVARDRNFVTIGTVKVRWYKASDGRTFVCGRRYGRKLVSFMDHQEALREARKLALEIHQGGAESLALTAADRAAWSKIQQFAVEQNVDPVEAMTEWRSAKARIGKLNFSDVITAGLAALERPAYTVGSQVEEFIGSKKEDDYDKRVFADFGRILGDFAKAFPCDIKEVEAKQIEEWLRGRKRKDGNPLSPKRSNEILQIVRSLFLFARKRGRLPDVPTAAQLIEKADVERGEISFYNPEEMIVILDVVDQEWTPWPVLVGFNGLRTEEVALGKHAGKRKDCLRWDDFDWHHKEIVVRNEVAKTGSNRRIKIHPNTWKFLKPWRDAKATGPVLPDGDHRGKIDRYRAKIVKRLKELHGKRADITARLAAWPSNALRHSYGSYRMAILGDVEKLAYEMGDSAAMIRKHYHNPRPRSHAKAWFAIEPKESSDRVIPFKTQLKKAFPAQRSA